MYTPRGCGVSELGDIEVVPHGDELHLFHLTLPNHDLVQHAVSRDGLSWTPLPAAIRTGDPGACDDDQIWTMSVSPRPGGDGFVMLYTALASADHGRVQRIAAATSSDLISWEKCAGNPIGEADPRWYEATPGPAPAVSWRDPKATPVGGQFLATICARERAAPVSRRGCVGLMISDDLQNWEVKPPLFAPRRYWDLECPQLFRLQDQGSEGVWHLTAAIMEDRSQRYWHADNPFGPFRVPSSGDRLAPPGHYAARVARWGERDLLFAWHQPRLADGWMSSSLTVDWIEARNRFGKFLAPPLVLGDRGDGSLSLASFPGWDEYRVGKWLQPQPVPRTHFNTAKVDPGPDWVFGSRGVMDLITATIAIDDFVAEGVLTIDAPRGGIALRLDEEGNGLYIELVSGSRCVSLQRWGTDRSAIDRSSRHAYAELQRMDRHEPVVGGVSMPFRLLSVGPYVELSLNGEVLIATMTGAPTPGQWGFWVQDGTAHASELRWAQMRQPGAEWDDWNDRLRENTLA